MTNALRTRVLLSLQRARLGEIELIVGGEGTVTAKAGLSGYLSLLLKLGVNGYVMVLLASPTLTWIDLYQHGVSVDSAHLLGSLVFVALLSPPVIIVAAFIAATLHYGINHLLRNKGKLMPLSVAALVGAVSGAMVAPDIKPLPVALVVGASSAVMVYLDLRILSWRWLIGITLGLLGVVCVVVVRNSL